MAEIVSLSQLQHKIEFLRSKNKDLVIVATNGCFDILHVGHVRYLQRAKKLGGLLVVGINTDSSIKKIKGNERPINKENDRAEVLAALECVNIISMFQDETAEKFLEIVKPDIYVKGDEYDLDKLPEAKVVKKIGGKTISIPMVPGFSTTDLINHLKKN